jgi:hypothetical protein
MPMYSILQTRNSDAGFLNALAILPWTKELP